MGKKENIELYYKKKSAIKYCKASRGIRVREAYQNCFRRAPNFKGTFKEFKTHIEGQFEFGKTDWTNYGIWELDHIIPLSKGGEHCVTNLQILTKNENRQKGSKILEPKQCERSELPL